VEVSHWTSSDSISVARSLRLAELYLITVSREGLLSARFSVSVLACRSSSRSCLRHHIRGRITGTLISSSQRSEIRNVFHRISSACAPSSNRELHDFDYILGTVFIYTTAVHATCYNHDSIVINNPGFPPCNQVAGAVSMCCGTNWTDGKVVLDVCYPDGLCINNDMGQPLFWR